MSRLVFRILAVAALLMAALAAVLPVVPAIPFLVLAAAAAARGWPWLEMKLSAHPRIGPAIAAWHARGALPAAVKALTLAGLACSGALAWLMPVAPWFVLAIDAALLAAGAWVWRRPTT
ncbi:MAG: DUF454 family protein [Burkholderiaceae bacterium]